MIALADRNTFFASVEKVFHSGLQGKPVGVLSSNDGNIVALTAEAKALGITRGEPYFKVKDIIQRNNVAVFSINILLYAAMSKCVQSIMRKTVEHTENYSINRYGKGILASPVEGMTLVGQNMLNEAYQHGTMLGYRRRGALGYRVHRGSTYDCPVCDTRSIGIHPVTEICLPTHPRCCCWTIPVFGEGV